MRRPILADFVATYRGGIVENRHAVHAAIVDATGKLLYTVGDSSRMTLARSAAKPAQALAIIETGAFDQFDFDEPDLALMCASNSSEERHIARARQMLSKAGVSESDLRCGGHTPSQMPLTAPGSRATSRRLRCVATAPVSMLACLLVQRRLVQIQKIITSPLILFRCM